MSLIALNNRVLIRPDKAPEKSSGGIIIPDTAKDSITTIRGVVLSAGPKVTQVRANARVVWNKYHGLWIEEGDELLLSIEEEFLLAFEQEKS